MLLRIRYAISGTDVGYAAPSGTVCSTPRPARSSSPHPFKAAVLPFMDAVLLFMDAVLLSMDAVLLFVLAMLLFMDAMRGTESGYAATLYKSTQMGYAAMGPQRPIAPHPSVGTGMGYAATDARY
eukprot:3941619-Rhodomonas_salina.2